MFLFNVIIAPKNYFFCRLAYNIALNIFSIVSPALFYLFFKSSWLFDSINHNSGADHITILSSGSNMILWDLCAALIIIALKLMFWLF